MSKERGKNVYGRRGNNVSLAPLSADDAMRRLLNVKPADLKAAEVAEKKATPKPRKK